MPNPAQTRQLPVLRGFPHPTAGDPARLVVEPPN